MLAIAYHVQDLSVVWCFEDGIVTFATAGYWETVADLKSVARKLVARCGLEWESNCVEFHQTKRPVRTASAVQVRQTLLETVAPLDNSA